MKTTDFISLSINRFPKGYVFTYVDFVTPVHSKETVIKALNRMVAAGKIAKLAKGKYYKVETTPFGALQPDLTQIVKDFLEDNGKTVGYLTGYSIYNKLGLTAQVSTTIQIGKNQIRPALQRERYKISFILQKNIITKDNIPLLQILDAIKYIKKIPASSIENSSKRLFSIIKSLPIESKNIMVRLSMKYPPMTRAFLGAMLNELGDETMSEPLRKSLNPITKYKLSGVNQILKSSEKWNII